MLALTRKPNEEIVIVVVNGGKEEIISVTVVDIGGDRVRLGIDAPRHIKVYRLEVYKAIKKEEAEKAKQAQANQQAQKPEDDAQAPS